MPKDITGASFFVSFEQEFDLLGVSILCFLRNLTIRSHLQISLQIAGEFKLLRKSMDWFLYDVGLRHEKVNFRWNHDKTYDFRMISRGIEFN